MNCYTGLHSSHRMQQSLFDMQEYDKLPLYQGNSGKNWEPDFSSFVDWVITANKHKPSTTAAVHIVNVCVCVCVCLCVSVCVSVWERER